MTTIASKGPAATRGRTLGRRLGPVGGTVPFFVYTALFLLAPAVIIFIGAFLNGNGSFTFTNIKTTFTGDILSSVGESLVLSVVSALIGAVVGGVVAYLVSTANPAGVLRRFVTSLSSVLAQFGGVMLGFAFLFTFTTRFGLGAKLYLALTGSAVDHNFFATLPGLIIVYTYFQVPLMVIIFLPAVDGIRPQWREACETLGGSTWVFWRRVAGPLLLPSFLGSFMLLFTNAFSAFATAVTLNNETNPLIVMQIKQALTSETGGALPNLAMAESLLMVVVVAIVLFAYAKVQRRSSRWLG